MFSCDGRGCFIIFQLCRIYVVQHVWFFLSLVECFELHLRDSCVHYYSVQLERLADLVCFCQAQTIIKLVCFFLRFISLHFFSLSFLLRNKHRQHLLSIFSCIITWILYFADKNNVFAVWYCLRLPSWFWFDVSRAIKVFSLLCVDKSLPLFTLTRFSRIFFLLKSFLIHPLFPHSRRSAYKNTVLHFYCSPNYSSKFQQYSFNLRFTNKDVFVL